MLMDIMDESDQFRFFVDKICDTILIHREEEDLTLYTEHKEMVISMLYDKTNYEFYKDKYEMRFMDCKYVYLVIYYNKEVDDIKNKIRYGYYNELSLEDFDKDIKEVCSKILNSYRDICSYSDVYENEQEMKEYFEYFYPYLNFFNICFIKMRLLTKHCTDEEIKNRIRALSYKEEFLHTIYWNHVRFLTLYEHGWKCLFCGTEDNLQIHHRTYKTHGLEHKREVQQKDLMIACKICHKKIHGFILNYDDVYEDDEYKEIDITE